MLTFTVTFNKCHRIRIRSLVKRQILQLRCGIKMWMIWGLLNGSFSGLTSQCRRSCTAHDLFALMICQETQRNYYTSNFGDTNSEALTQGADLFLHVVLMLTNRAAANWLPWWKLHRLHPYLSHDQYISHKLGEK